MMAVILGGCFTSKEVDGTESFFGPKLVERFAAVPGLGTETTYTLEVKGHEPLRVECPTGVDGRRTGGIETSPDKSRLAFWCGNKQWRVVYKVKGKLIEECPPYAMGDTLNWDAAKDFKTAAPELVRCSSFSTVSQLFRQVATEPELPRLFIQSLGMTKRLGKNNDFSYWDPTWRSELQASPASVQEQVREGLKVRFARVDSIVDAAALTDLMTVVGADKETEPLLHSLFLRAVAQHPREDSLESALAWVRESWGDAVATHYACEAMALGSIQKTGALLLASSQMPCEAFDHHVASQLSEPSLLCNPHIQCDQEPCSVTEHIQDGSANSLTQSEQEQIAVLAAVQRKQVPAWFPLAIRRRGYVVEMPQTPACAKAEPGTPCACDVKVCEMVGPKEGRTPSECKLEFDDKRKHIRVVAP
ncbi:hypothetical protein JGU66_03965 [Myxococcaceae bacterium JPH2]|nr:hypothetical protein [Myxococcaceae bacterium JPH2]